MKHHAKIRLELNGVVVEESIEFELEARKGKDGKEIKTKVKTHLNRLYRKLKNKF